MRKLKADSFIGYLISDIIKIVVFFLVLFLLLFIYVFFVLIHKIIIGIDITKLVEFIYALFLANVAATTMLFALERSPTFNDISDKTSKKLIYYSSIMFLCAAFISLFNSAYAYINIASDVTKDNFVSNEISMQIEIVSVTGATGLSVIFSMAGLIILFICSIKAMKKITSDKKNKNNSKDEIGDNASR